MADVYELLATRFGGKTEALTNEMIPQSTNADQIFLGQQPRRLAFTVINLSANPVFIRPNAVASAAAGISCPAGTITTIGYPDDLHLAALEWHMVSPAGNSAVTYIAVQYTEDAGAIPSGPGAF